MTTSDQPDDAPGRTGRIARRSLLLGAGLLAGQVATANRRGPTRAQDQPVATPGEMASPGVGATPAVDATPTAGGSGCPVDGPCPVGCWVVSDIGAFIESGLMDASGLPRLRYASAGGTLRFAFSPDGVIRIVADGYRVAVAAKLRIVGEVDAAVSFDGVLTGRYALVGEELTIAEVAREALVITAETPVGAIGIDNNDFFAGGVSRLVCDGETIRLYPDPTDDVAIVLTREGADGA